MCNQVQLNPMLHNKNQNLTHSITDYKMNLFSNIFDQFTGQAQSQVPSFGTPQTPRTSSYVAPDVPTTQLTQTGIGSTTTQKPINTSLPM